MENLKFNDSQMKKIESYLKSQERSVCCSNPQIVFSNEIHSLPLISQPASLVGMEVFVTVCKTCAKTEMFNLKVSNILS
ncbi:hypothetical protein [Macrococcoides caseolyticum]|uniref:Uncharacterized protein n=1 Tax=Macrococcoides caseolyticum TaxID=69966 RepID=A0ACC9MT76_9STAP|nr:hypothetical protein [Macrococcus caseolyticus]ARQ04737.1 hypothetical protein CA207_14910 [Macrococcus caseolyticus]PKE39515.1 hypothetical protein CW675_06120 [Macrococcus caseolyticus]PKE56774.1 hypothetical protein CW682_04475 [Macrococcus caseolyticus]PKF22420.1 hypothetical protein CW684_01030 [Macrococcus caseolyticus]PKF37017.1 hypothetical protein CW687_00485 [Macrococcus caseolyticus]